jgi:hypothetical protein
MPRKYSDNFIGLQKIVDLVVQSLYSNILSEKGTFAFQFTVIKM